MRCAAAILVCLVLSLFADEGCPVVSVDIPQQRADEVPLEVACCDDDTYIQGYLQALVDMHYHEYRVKVEVSGNTATLSHLPANCLTVRSIVNFVRDFPGIEYVIAEERCCRSWADYTCPPPCIPSGRIRGIWFPQSTELFQPLVADPRQIKFSASWRFHDDVFMTGIAATSFGDSFPLYRWLDVGPWHGDFQVGVEAGVWAVFQFEKDPYANDGDDVALINTDFYVAPIYFTYAAGNWSFRFRVYHISSHLGDEFMISHRFLRRVNPSREAVDLFASYQITSAIRLYLGPGINFHSDPSFPIDPFYVEYGLELRILGQRIFCHQLFLQPYYAMHIRNWQTLDWKFDATYVAGFEISRLQGIGRKVRAYAQYHDGFSLEGQFFKCRTKYIALALSWGF